VKGNTDHIVPAGNLTMLDVSHTYTFDALGAMTKQVDGAATREYVYTADDERIGVYNGSWDWTVRDLGGRVLREYTSTGASGTSNWKWRRDHVYRGSQLLATVNQKYDASDNAVTGTITYHLHLDHLGTPRLITDDAGLLLAEHAYYPFGPELSTSLTESPRDPKQYTGHERDDIADIHGLDYMHARYYGAAVGRFLSVDPARGSMNLHLPQSWDRYSYALDSPIRYTDPDGRCVAALPCPAWLLAGTETVATQVGTRAAAGSAAGPISLSKGSSWASACRGTQSTERSAKAILQGKLMSTKLRSTETNSLTPKQEQKFSCLQQMLF
jgi:RHS repeat-associated protein